MGCLAAVCSGVAVSPNHSILSILRHHYCRAAEAVIAALDGPSWGSSARVTGIVGHAADHDGGRSAMASSLIDALGSQTGGLTLLKLLADNSFDSILVTDASARGRIIYANKAFKKLTGHDPTAVIGKDPRILQGPGTDKKVIERISATLKAGGRFEGRAVNYRKDGTPFIMNWRMFPLKDAGKITAWVAIQREALAAT
jgi:PAS domain S-box-containing protein